MKSRKREGNSLVVATIFTLFFLILMPSVSLASFKDIPTGTEYVIITSQALKNQFQVLADYYNKGFIYKTFVYTLEEIMADYGQTRITKEAVRNFIKRAKTELNIKYVLLGGSINIIPIYYGIATDGVYGLQDIPTDMYYSGLEGDWYRYPPDMTAYGQRVNPNFPLRYVKQQVDLTAEVLVGRAPVRNLRDAANFVNKTIKYRAGRTWRKHVLMVASDIVDGTDMLGYPNAFFNSLVPLLPTNSTVETIYDCPLVPGTNTPIIECTCPANPTINYPPGSPIVQGTWDLNTLLNGRAVNWANGPAVHGLNDNNWGYGIVLSEAHGSPTGVLGLNAWSIHFPQDTYLQLKNTNPFILYELDCFSASLDGWAPPVLNANAPDRICIGEKLMNSAYGFAAMLGNTRGGLRKVTEPLLRAFLTESQKGIVSSWDFSSLPLDSVNLINNLKINNYIDANGKILTGFIVLTNPASMILDPAFAAFKTQIYTIMKEALKGKVIARALQSAKQQKFASGVSAYATLGVILLGDPTLTITADTASP